MKSICKSLTLLLILFIPAGCMEEYEMQLPFEEPKLFADVLISSEPNASSIIIGWTYPVDTECFFENYYEGYPIPCKTDTLPGPYRVTGTILLIEKESGFTLEYPIQMEDKQGFMRIAPDIVGIPGYSYSLQIDINYNNSISSYYSETSMLQTPPIDQMSYEIRKGNVGKSDNFVPLIYFDEPQYEKNYYLFRLCEGYEQSQFCSNGRSWSYSVLKDDFLPARVRGLSIDDGATVATYAEFYPSVSAGVGVQVRMYSVHREAYEFYKALLDQFNNDGGAYAPTPASPKGNISGGAIGLFRALHESSGVVYM